MVFLALGRELADADALRAGVWIPRRGAVFNGLDECGHVRETVRRIDA
jgi:hypothetical protein